MSIYKTARVDLLVRTLITSYAGNCSLCSQRRELLLYVRDSLLQVKPAAGKLLQQTMGRNLPAHARRERRLRLLQCELARAPYAFAPPAAAEPRHSRRRTSVRATGVTVSVVPKSCVHLRSELAEQPPRVVAPLVSSRISLPPRSGTARPCRATSNYVLDYEARISRD